MLRLFLSLGTIGFYTPEPHKSGRWRASYKTLGDEGASLYQKNPFHRRITCVFQPEIVHFCHSLRRATPLRRCEYYDLLRSFEEAKLESEQKEKVYESR